MNSKQWARARVLAAKRADPRNVEPMTSMQVPIVTAAALILALLLEGCAGTDRYADRTPSGPAFSGEQMRARLEGNTVVVENYRAYHGPISIYFPVYGEMRGLRSNHYRDAGTWRVTDDRVCLTWQNWWSNVERCWSGYAYAGGILWVAEDGTSTDVTMVEPGNADEL